MPDQPVLPDIHRPLPDEAHEALRAGLVAAIDDLAVQVSRINDAWLLLSVNADFAQATKNTVMAGQAAIAQMQTTAAALSQSISAVNTRAEAAQISARAALANCDLLQTQVAALTDRVAALEPPPVDPPVDPPGDPEPPAEVQP